MITRKTVFILGAGASKPYGFPTGKKLLKDFYSLDRDDTFLDLAKNAFPLIFLGQRETARGFFVSLINEMKGSRVRSIDAYFSDISAQRKPDASHKENIGKFAISYFLDKCERENPNLESVENEDWYDYLYNEFLKKRCRGLDDFFENKVSFVTFNYDLSLEKYLSSALQISYGLNNFEDLLKKMPIIHVHGKIQAPPPVMVAGRIVQSPLDIIGSEPPDVKKSKEIYWKSQSIQFAHDPSDPSDSLGVVRTLLGGAERVFFLGFGFIDANMDKLSINWVNQIGSPNDGRHTSYFGTCLGFEGSEQERLITSLNAIDGKRTRMLELQNMNCLKFLQHYASAI